MWDKIKRILETIIGIGELLRDFGWWNRGKIETIQEYREANTVYWDERLSDREKNRLHKMLTEYEDKHLNSFDEGHDVY